MFGFEKIKNNTPKKEKSNLKESGKTFTLEDMNGLCDKEEKTLAPFKKGLKGKLAALLVAGTIAAGAFAPSQIEAQEGNNESEAYSFKAHASLVSPMYKTIEGVNFNISGDTHEGYKQTLKDSMMNSLYIINSGASDGMTRRVLQSDFKRAFLRFAALQELEKKGLDSIQDGSIEKIEGGDYDKVAEGTIDLFLSEIDKNENGELSKKS